MTEQRVVVVTGGGSGIGRAVASSFAHHGDQVIILGRTEAKLQQVVNVLGPCVRYEVTDMSQRDQVERSIESILNAFDRIDILINNAGFVRGISAETPLAQAEEIWEQEIGTNLKGSFLMAVGIAPHLLRLGGRIINIGSIAAYTGGSRGGALGYSSAKAGLHGLTCALARELSPQGITVNTVSPGPVTDTDFFGGGLRNERIKEIVDQIPVGRTGKPQDIANTVFFLASNEASYITGEVIHVNGGWIFGR